MCAIWVSTHCCNPEDFPQWRGNCVNATWNTDDSYPNTLEPNFFLKNKIFDFLPLPSRGLPWWLSWLRICLQCGRPGFNSWVGKIPWKREWLSTAVFRPGEFHELYSPWGGKGLDITERLPLSLSPSNDWWIYSFVCFFFVSLIWLCQVLALAQ